jgi:hypothetical protein
MNPHKCLTAFFGKPAHFFEGKVYDAVIDAADPPFPDRFSAFVRKQQLDIDNSEIIQTADLYRLRICFIFSRV